MPDGLESGPREDAKGQSKAFRVVVGEDLSAFVGETWVAGRFVHS